MDSEDASFESDIACAIAKLESMKLPPFPADLYALMWTAAHSCRDAPAAREMFERCAQESAENYPWSD